MAALAGERDDIVSEVESLKDETQGNFDNMPEGLQQGDSGQLLEQRVSTLEEFQSELEGLDIPDDEDDFDEQPIRDEWPDEGADDGEYPDDREDGEDLNAYIERKSGEHAEQVAERVQAAIEELQGLSCEVD